MKELEPVNPVVFKDKTEVSVKKQQQIEYVLEGSLRPKPGQFVFEVNKLTGEVRKAEFKKKTVVLGATAEPDELICSPECVYIPALNKENALKKYKKNPEQSAYYFVAPPANLKDIYSAL